MKESGVEWIGAIPKSWNILRVKRKFIYKKEIVGEKSEEYERLSLTLRGVLKRPKNDNEGLQPEKFSGYQILEHNDLVFKLIDLENISTSRVGLSSFTGIVSPAYIRLICLDGINSKFAYYFFISMWHQNIFNGLGGDGVRSNLNSTDLLNLSFVEVPKAEQQKIAAFLDEKVAHIDNIIEDTKKSIENLKFYKQSLITETVTKGLNPNVEMKDSGIEWIGEIPKHWRVTKVKNFVQIKNGKDNKVKDGEIPVYGSGGVFGKTDQIMYEKASVLLGRKGTIDSPKYIEKPFWAVDTTFYTIAKPNIALKFFYYLMKSIDYKKYTYGSAIPSMSQSILNEIKLPYTNLDEQKQIAIFLDDKTSHVDSLIEQKEQLVAELESYKKSLIYECVTGKKEVK